MSDPLLPQANASTTPSFAGSPPQSYSLLFRGSEFSVHVARTAAHRSESAELVAQMYQRRGYDLTLSDDIRTYAGEVTFVACHGASVFGTLTVCIESPFGLPADAAYRAELAPFRLARRRLMELTGLAVRPEHGSRSLLAALFHLSHIYGTLLQRATDVVIEVNPRHVLFYERMLHFRQVGPQKTCPRVQAPAILLHLETAQFSRNVARSRGQRSAMGKSLYPYFFSVHEEAGLTRRMQQLTTDAQMPTSSSPADRLYSSPPREAR